MRVINSSKDENGRSELIYRVFLTTNLASRPSSGEYSDIVEADVSEGNHDCLSGGCYRSIVAGNSNVTTTRSSPMTTDGSELSQPGISEEDDIDEVHNGDNSQSGQISTMPPDDEIIISRPRLFTSSFSRSRSPSSRKEHAQFAGSRLPYTPTKRHPHRSPPSGQVSSVRAIQMDMSPSISTRSSYSYPQHRQSQQHRLARWSSPDRGHSQQLTPRSSRSRADTTIKYSQYALAQDGSTNQTQQTLSEHPVVLLHVTLLPIQLHYSLDLMTAVLPPYIMNNYHLLKEKISRTVLARGILLPHPKEEYELLEERLLESLELTIPRVTKCGHFHPPSSSSSDTEKDEERDDDMKLGDMMDQQDSADDSVQKRCVAEGEIKEDEQNDGLCATCGRQFLDGRIGIGRGPRKWEVKVYAANGLMRAGTWAAAWQEMERVDVEIEPWIPTNLRAELERRIEAAQFLERDRNRGLEMEIPTPTSHRSVARPSSVSVTSTPKARMRRNRARKRQANEDGLGNRQRLHTEVGAGAGAGAQAGRDLEAISPDRPSDLKKAHEELLRGIYEDQRRSKSNRTPTPFFSQDNRFPLRPGSQGGQAGLDAPTRGNNDRVELSVLLKEYIQHQLNLLKTDFETKGKALTIIIIGFVILTLSFNFFFFIKDGSTTGIALGK